MPSPRFPDNPGIGQLFPGTPVPNQTQYIYLGEDKGWVSREVKLQKTPQFGRGARRRRDA